MDEKTNIERVENMLYNIGGCSPEEARKILYQCLINAELKIKSKNRIKLEEKEDEKI
jgi:hypothetical protein